MKKAMVLGLAVVLVVASMLTGVFALYTTDLDGVNGGSVAAKNFVLVGNTTEDFGTDVKMAPSETKTSTFTVANFNETFTTETDMDVKIEITFTSDIVPLKLSLTDGDGTVLIENVVAGASATTYGLPTGFVARQQETKTFKIVITWVSSDNDNAYLSKTASYSVRVTGTQKIAA